MKSIFRSALIIGMTTLVGLGMFECVLRAAPELIGLPFLARYERGLQVSIAQRLGLPVADSYRVLKSADRADKGRDISLFQPNATYLWPADAADREAGALESQSADAYGFCNPKGAYQQAPVDVLVIGGSVPSCTAVMPEETFAAQLGTKLAVKSYNMTVGGSGPNDYVEVLRAHGLQLKPRLVILAYAESNDIRDCLLHEEFVANPLPANPVQENGSALNPMTWSYALNFVHAGGATVVKSFKRSAAENFRYQVTVQGAPYELNTRNGDLDELDLARKLQTNPDLIESCRKPLAEFVTLANANNFKPVVMLVPAAYTAYGEATKFNGPDIAPVVKNMHVRQVEWLAENAATIGYEFVDPTNEYTRAISSTPPAYLPSNVHFTAEGQKTLAQTLAPRVKKLLEAAE
jgi:hypothetical protein